MLKNLILAKNIKDQREQLAALEAKDAEFAAQGESLTADIEAAATKEEREAVEAAVSDYDTALAAHEEAKAQLSGSIKALEAELAALESQPLPAPAKAAAEPKNERMISMVPALTNIRKLPINCRAFDTLPEASQQSILADPETRKFIANVRALRTVNTSVTGADLAIPVSILPLLNENRFRYSKLMNRVLVRTVRGEVHQPIGGLSPEAIWEDCCDALNELDFAYSMVSLTCNKVGGFVLICNSLLAETDSDLLADLIEMISEALGKAKDKAILYGKGKAYSMPAGIVPRLAQESKPSDYPANAPEWVDLHTTHILQVDGTTLDGAAFWAALRIAAGNTFNLYARGELSWVMNSKTYAYLESKAIVATASGQWVALLGGRLPIVSGNIDVLEFVPDGDIIGGYFQLYLWAQHEAAFIGTDRAGLQLRVKDATLVFGRERADGMPLIPEAFVAMNIMGQAVTTVMDFPANSANDADLQGLTIGQLSLSPSFDAAVPAYTASATNATSSVSVNAVPAQPGALVTVTVTAGTTTKTVNNGGNAALAVGANVIAVTVKQGNATKVYTVTVTRAAS